MSEKVTLQIEFTVGTLKELGFGGIKQPLASAERDGISCDLMTSAGLGSPLIEARAGTDDRAIYAVADIRALADALWNIMHLRLGKGTENDQDT